MRKPSHRSLPTFVLAPLLAAGGVLLVVGCQSGAGASAEESEAAALKPEDNIRAGLPPDAQEMTSGRGTITYAAHENGTVYLYDLNANAVVGTYHDVAEGDTLRVSGSSQRATLNGNEVVTTTGLRANRTYIVYLVPDAPMTNTGRSGTSDAGNSSRNGRLYVELAEEGADEQE